MKRLRVDTPGGSSYEFDGSCIQGGDDGVEEAAVLIADDLPRHIVTIIEEGE